MIQVVYRYILTAGTVLPCQVILQGCPSAVSVEPLLSLLLLFLLHVWHTRECIYHHFSLSQQHCIWKRIKEKGKADGTGMYMWTARHKEHRFLLRKLSFFKWVHMYILTDGDSQQSNLPRSILAEDENPDVQRTMLMPYQRLDSALDASRLAQQECKNNAGACTAEGCDQRYQWGSGSALLFPFQHFIVDPYTMATLALQSLVRTSLLEAWSLRKNTKMPG